MIFQINISIYLILMNSQNQAKLQGSYRLHCAPICIQIKGEVMAIPNLRKLSFLIEMEQEQKNESTQNQNNLFGCKRIKLKLRLHPDSKQSLKIQKKIKRQDDYSRQIQKQGYQSKIISLFEQIQEFQIDSKQGLIRMYGPNHIFCIRGRRGVTQEKTVVSQVEQIEQVANQKIEQQLQNQKKLNQEIQINKDKGIQGSWQVELVNLALQVYDNKFQFISIDHSKHSYSYVLKGIDEMNRKLIDFITLQSSTNNKTPNKDHKITQKPGLHAHSQKQQQKQKNKQVQKQQGEKNKQKSRQNQFLTNFIEIFIYQLQISIRYELGQVSFKLFNQDNQMTAKGTPYV